MQKFVSKILRLFKDDGSWKAFAEVKDSVAERYYAKLLESIRTNYSAAIAPETAPGQMIPDYAATLRLYSYVKTTKDKLQKDPVQIASLTRESSALKTEALGVQPPLSEQWKLEKSAYQISRSNADSALDHSHAFNLSAGDWTKVNTSANGDLNFFHLANKSNSVTEKAVSNSVNQTRRLLSDDVQQRLMRHVLAIIQEKGAISLDYLKQVAEIDQMSSEMLQNEG